MFGLREAFLGAVIKRLDLTCEKFLEEYWKKVLDIEIEAITCEARIRVETAGVEARAKTQMTLDNCEAAQAEARLRVVTAQYEEEAIISASRRSTAASTAAPTRQRKKTVVIDTWQNVNELRHIDSPFCGEELEALKRLPSHFEYDAYRAAGIPDNAVPRTPDQAKEWYDLACHENLKDGSSSSFFPPFRNPENL